MTITDILQNHGERIRRFRPKPSPVVLEYAQASVSFDAHDHKVPDFVISTEQADVVLEAKLSDSFSESRVLEQFAQVVDTWFLIENENIKRLRAEIAALKD